VDASFKIYHKEIFDYLKIESETGFSDAETLVKARYLGMTIKQVGVNHYPRRAGRVSFQLAQRGLFQGLVKFNAIRDLWNDLRSFYRRLSKGLYWKDRLNSVKIRKIGG